jgi:hypothetical protein
MRAKTLDIPDKLNCADVAGLQRSNRYTWMGKLHETVEELINQMNRAKANLSVVSDG